MTKEADDFLMGGAPSASFLDIGDKCVGTILSYEKVQQRDFDTGQPAVWDDGSPRWQVVFTVQTEENDPELEHDDGRRRVYAKGQMLSAIRDAVKAAGVRGDLVGGKLGVVYAGNGEAKRRGAAPPKQFTAKFEPRPQTDDLDEFSDAPF